MMRSASGNANGRRRTPFTTAKMAALAPIPMASVATAVTVKTGVRRRERQEYRTDWDSDMDLVLCELDGTWYGGQ